MLPRQHTDRQVGRQVLGAIAEFDKAMTVAKLRGARGRKRKANGKCEGRKSLAEMYPGVVREAQTSSSGQSQDR